MGDERVVEFLSAAQCRVVVLGVHPPALADEAMRRKLEGHFLLKAKLSEQFLNERLRLASHRERTRMALEFNRALERKCRAEDVLFVEIATDIIDAETGVVREEFTQ